LERPRSFGGCFDGYWYLVGRRSFRVVKTRSEGKAKEQRSVASSGMNEVDQAGG
jgi:hypothetical protein